MTKNLPAGVDINNLIDDLRIFSWEAADILLFYSKKLKDSFYKEKIIRSENIDDPVTLADLEVNNLIIKRINEIYKDVCWEILSEENVKKSSSGIDLKAKFLWILDPLDGTKDFIQGSGNYAMHLALNCDHKPNIGIVLIPEKNELWISHGNDIFCEGRDGIKRTINLSKNKRLRDMTIVTSKNHRNENLESLINKIAFKRKIIMGSIGCKIASIVRGESDIYISLSMPGKSSPKDWDFAAPEAILRAAGGSVTNIENNDLSYFKSDFSQGGIIIASNNKQNHGNICSQIKSIIQKYDLYPI